MHDIWNPWHGCVKCSEGCENCYMYYLDEIRGGDGAQIRLTSNARYPLSRDRKGRYKIQSGEMISVCMTSDFFLEEADAWRNDVEFAVFLEAVLLCHRLLLFLGLHDTALGAEFTETAFKHLVFAELTFQ